MENREEIAVSKFCDGFNCAQSVLFSYCDDLGLNTEIALKQACGFGAGMGRKEEVCGAISGGILVIGTKYGKYKKEDSNSGEDTYKKTRDLMDFFEKIHGTYICKKLLGEIDLATESGQNIFREKELKKNVCIPCVRTVMNFLDTII